MKPWLFITLVMVLALSACSQDSKVFINETVLNDTMADGEPAASEEPPREAPEEQLLVKEIETIKAEDPGLTISASISNVRLVTPAFGKSEEYELKMLLSKAQHTGLQKATLALTPVCDEKPVLRVTLNDNEAFYEEIACKKATVIELSAEEFIEGPNTIKLQNDITEEYQLEDIGITLFKEGNETVFLEGDDHLFKPAEAEPITIKETTDVTITNHVERTLKLKESQVQKNLYLSFDTNVKAGSLLVILNGHEVYYEEQGKTKEVLIKLPKEYLTAGDNELVFVGIE